jgi:hypothetical protein
MTVRLSIGKGHYNWANESETQLNVQIWAPSLPTGHFSITLREDTELPGGRWDDIWTSACRYYLEQVWIGSDKPFVAAMLEGLEAEDMSPLGRELACGWAEWAKGEAARLRDKAAALETNADVALRNWAPVKPMDGLGMGIIARSLGIIP